MKRASPPRSPKGPASTGGLPAAVIENYEPYGSGRLLHDEGVPPSRSTEEELAAANTALHVANERLRQVIRKLEEEHRAQNLFQEVSRDLLLARTEGEAVELVGRAVRRLLPGRRFCVRIVDPETLVVTAHFWDNGEPPTDPNIIRFKRTAFDRMRLPSWLESHPRIEIMRDYTLVFEGTREGFAMPLVASGELHGLVNVEFPHGLLARREEDGLRLRPLVNLASVVVRKLGLRRETLFLKENLGKLVENANALIVVADTQRQIRIFNREIQRVTGFTKEEVVAAGISKLLPEDEVERFEGVFGAALRGEVTTGFEGRIRARDGTEIKVIVNAAPLLGAGGAVEGVIAVGQDTTKVRDLESQMIHAEKLATLGQLAAGVVHEVNTPLTSIAVYAEFLYKKLLAEGREAPDLEKLRRIIDGAERIRHLTRDLTAYARPKVAEAFPVAMNDIIRKCASFCEHVIAGANAQVQLLLDPNLPRVRGAADQLQQVFINLLTNACDAVAEAGGGVIEIHTTREPKGGVLVVVEDDGVGLRVTDPKRIFEPFYTTKPPGKGTGLGLSIVREIVQSHGGRIDAESRPGRGAIFRVALPAEGAAPEET